MTLEPNPERKGKPSAQRKSESRPRRKKPLTLTKRELVSRIADATGLTKAVVKDIVQRFLDAVIEELGRENRIEFRDFGIFYVKRRPPRKAHNPKTLAQVDVPARRVVKFRAGRFMKAVVSGDRPPKPLDPGRYGDD